jgi:hypothetical protein
MLVEAVVHSITGRLELLVRAVLVAVVRVVRQVLTELLELQTRAVVAVVALAVFQQRMVQMEALV